MLAVTKNAALITNAVAAPESVSPFKVKRKAFSGKAFMMAEASGNQVIITVSQNSFGVYIFHSPIITGIAILCSGIALPMLAKHFIVFPVSYILSLAVSFVLRKIPYLARITA